MTVLLDESCATFEGKPAAVGDILSPGIVPFREGIPTLACKSYAKKVGDARSIWG